MIFTSTKIINNRLARIHVNRDLKGIIFIDRPDDIKNRHFSDASLSGARRPVDLREERVP